MHMTDVWLSPMAAVVMYVMSGIMAGISFRQAGHTSKVHSFLASGITASLVFVLQMISYTLPGTGASARFIGGVLLASVLGPYVGFLSMLLVLLVQALWFADGGLMSLGANGWNIAFCGCFVGFFFAYRLVVKSKISSERMKLLLASFTGCFAAYQTGIFSVCAELAFSDVPGIEYSAFFRSMQSLCIIPFLTESLVTAGVLWILHNFGSHGLELLGKKGSDSRRSAVQRCMIAVAAVVSIVGIGSSLSGDEPDVLEKALHGSRLEEYEGELEIRSSMSDKAEQLQQATVFMPDYEFVFAPECSWAFGAAGIAGMAVVFILVGGLCELGRFYEDKQSIR